MIQQSGGQLLVRALQTHGTRQVFCVPGESYLPVLDALYDSGINNTVCRHEGGAAMMAESWGKLTGQPGICMVTRGPGACNATAGLHVAMQDSTPMILFIGQIGSECREREAFQEMNYRQFLGSVVKWVAEIDSADRIEEMVSRAFHVATSGRPGPVALALPEDTLQQLAAPVPIAPWQQVETHPGQDDMQTLAERIQLAERPVVIVGGSRWSEHSVQKFQALAQSWQLPVACSFRRQMLFDHTHPHFIGDVGISLNPALQAQISESDLVIMIGGRLSEVPSQDYRLLRVPSPVQPLVHVYPGAEELGRVYRATQSINASPTAFVDALSHLPVPAPSTARAAQITQAHDAYLRWSTADAAIPGEVQMSQIINHLAEALPEDAVLTNGAGNYATWVHRFWRFRRYGSQLAPTSGSMGYGLPAAIAAKLAAPDRTVVAFAGDGCFQMTQQELATAVQAQIALIIIVIDNGMYGTIRMHQEKTFPGRVSATDLHNPDFAALASAYGIFSASITRTDQFPAALALALEATTPSLLHIRISPEAITPSSTLTEMRESAEADQLTCTSLT